MIYVLILIIANVSLLAGVYLGYKLAIKEDVIILKKKEEEDSEAIVMDDIEVVE